MSQCPRGNPRNITHDGLVHNYAQMFREAGFITRTEPRNEFTHMDDSAKRPDLLVYNSKGGRACFDISVTHPACLHYAQGTIPAPGQAASNREQQKYDKYKELASNAGMSFYPLVHEAYGRVGISSHRIIKTCAAKISTLRRCHEGNVLHYWRTRLSLALHISQARAVHERFRDSQLTTYAGPDESSRLNYNMFAQTN